MSRNIVIGSRGSELALLYAKKAKDSILKNTDLSDDEILIKSITTDGDQVKDVRLSEFGGKGLFSSNIEKELQNRKIDIAVHALKDLPVIETKGLMTNFFFRKK